jgi:hypothetical protein
MRTGFPFDFASLLFVSRPRKPFPLSDRSTPKFDHSMQEICERYVKRILRGMVVA